MINVFQPTLGTEEAERVAAVMRSNWIGKGKLVGEFETRFAEVLGVPASRLRSTTCCTEGLFQIIEFLGYGEGDEVILPSISFVGAANAIAARKAVPVFCDVDPRTLNATAETIAAKLTPRTRAVMIIHYGGLPCEMDPILALAKEKNLIVIEDNACSPVSTYRGRSCGTIGEFGAWSFDAMKILAVGDGGLVFAKDDETALELERQMYLGLVTKSGLSNALDKKWWEFEISNFGRRAIMNDLTAAVALEQLTKLPGFIARRREIVEWYDRAFAGLNWLATPPQVPAHTTSSYYLYWVQLEAQHRDGLAKHLREKGIYTTFRYYPLHKVEHYQSHAPLPGAELASNTTLCLPLHQALSGADVETVIAEVKAYGTAERLGT